MVGPAELERSVVDESREDPTLIDLNFQGVPGVIASFIFRSGGELGLIETGPTTTLPTLEAALEPLGGLAALRHLVITHVHLDHAGAVGHVLDRAPQAVCYVHGSGVRHLVDPSRLLRSATRIYGDQMQVLWGNVKEAPAGRVLAVDDGDEITIGGRLLRVLHTPGHATHHIALYDAKSGTIFTGDAAGVRLHGMQQVRPPTPPPDLDPELWKSSVARMRSLNATRLYLTHFGSFHTDLDKHFDSMLARLDSWIDLVKHGRDRGEGSDTIAPTLQRQEDAEVRAEGGTSLTLRQYELATPYGMTVDGILHYLSKQDSAES